jgi:retron-type reverse transcriptase
MEKESIAYSHYERQGTASFIFTGVRAGIRDIGNNNSYGFRKERSTADAIESVLKICAEILP